MKMTPAAMIAARRDAYPHAQEREEPAETPRPG